MTLHSMDTKNKNPLWTPVFPSTHTHFTICHSSCLLLPFPTSSFHSLQPSLLLPTYLSYLSLFNSSSPPFLPFIWDLLSILPCLSFPHSSPIPSLPHDLLISLSTCLSPSLSPHVILSFLASSLPSLPSHLLIFFSPSSCRLFLPYLSTSLFPFLHPHLLLSLSTSSAT